MAFRRDRSIRDMYEQRFHPDRSVPYPRGGGGGGERRSFGRPDDDYMRNFDYDSPRFYPNGGPRNYHNEDKKGYHSDSHYSFSNESRGGPANRRDDSSYYRGHKDDGHSGRQVDFRGGRSRVGSSPSDRTQGSYPAPRSLSALGSNPGEDTLIQAIMNLDRGEEREGLRRKAPFPPVQDCSPTQQDVSPSHHSRSGSSISSRSYSPDRSKSHTYQPPLGKNRDRAPGPSVNVSRDGSPHSSVSASKEDVPVVEHQSDEPLAPADDTVPVPDDFRERRSQAIAAKAREIEKMYRQDCETFGMVVKMLTAKDQSLEKLLQNALKENLCEIRERCLEDLRHFISELDEAVRQPEPV
ncbi:periphilin-1 isoform 2-T3 [Clarias gariepinus]|uniref:periphilin-1 isoform X1 n=2 Tax=Clarias gariepinus TaxID=13013 RepID=UPI00234D580D|nr:periphilin-1 isoform X1 [Clarias gariepinus]XP_053364940.1 periphilin-1 isoform X1 [Clarias gariepinus]